MARATERPSRRMIVLAMMVVMAATAATATFARGVVSQTELVSVERDLGSIENLRLISGSMKIEVSQTRGRARLEAMLDSRRELKVTGSDGAVMAESSSGSQDYRDVKGEIVANAESGSIRLDDVTGVLSISAGSGDVTGISVALTGDSSFTTSSGSIDMTFENSEGELSFDLDAGSGEIRVGDTHGADRVIIGTGGIEVRGRSESGDQDYTTG